MKNKILKIAGIVTLILIFLYYAIQGFAVFMLTYFANPPRAPLTKEEVPIMNSIKKEFKTEEVVRVPELEKDFNFKESRKEYNEQYNNEYGVIIEKAICDDFTKKDIYFKAKNIAYDFENKIKPNSNFTSYYISVACKVRGKGDYFRFDRDSLKRGLYK